MNHILPEFFSPGPESNSEKGRDSGRDERVFFGGRMKNEVLKPPTGTPTLLRSLVQYFPKHRTIGF